MLGGEAVTVAPDVRWFGPPGTATFARVGRRPAARARAGAGPSRLAWLDRNGRELGRLGEPARYGQFSLARDGRRVAVEVWNQEMGNRDLWNLDVASDVSTRLTFDPREANSPVWSPDGKRMAFGRVLGDPPDVAVRTLDGGSVVTILEAPGVQTPKDWSPDGRLIAYDDFMISRRAQRQLWLVSLDGQNRRFRETPASTSTSPLLPGRPHPGLRLGGVRAPRGVRRSRGR